jgi:hypothetical protein
LRLEVDVSTNSLRIKNNSAATIYFFVCRSLSGMQAGVTPVWQTDELPPNGMRHIEWDADDISFAWANMGPMAPGARFDISGTLPANQNRRAVLDRVAANTYTLMPSSDGPPPAGSYVIMSRSSVPPNEVALGLTFGENALVAAETGPNLNVQFTMSAIKLAIVRSQVLAPVGLMVPPELLMNSVEIDLGHGSDWVATYQLDGTWNITRE